MSDNIIHIQNLKQYQSLIEEETRAILVDFYADFCGPCKMIAPFLDKLADSSINKHICFVKVNVEEAEDVAAHLSIQAMPTFIAYKNGQKYTEFRGASKEKITQIIKELVA
jgi:thioredoxin 1